MRDFLAAVELSVQLRSRFKPIADLLGANKAFYVVAGEVVKAGLDVETEERVVAILRAVYDEYVAAAAGAGTG